MHFKNIKFTEKATTKIYDIALTLVDLCSWCEIELEKIYI